METSAIARKHVPHGNSVNYIVGFMRKIVFEDEVLDKIVGKYVFFVTYYMFADKIKCVSSVRKVLNYDEKFIYLNGNDFVDRINNPNSLFVPKLYAMDNHISVEVLNPNNLIDEDFNLKYQYGR